MFTCKRDFGFFGRLFGVPRAWLSHVGAFCSSWSTEGRLLNLSIPALPDPENAPIKLGIDEDALTEFVRGVSGDGDSSESVGANKLLGTDAAGKRTAVADLPTAAPTSNKVLTVKQGTTSPTWEDGFEPPSNPSTKTTLGHSTSTSALTTTYTHDGNRGLTVSLITRVIFSGSASSPTLTTFRRNLTFDKYGRLYSVGSETAYTVDTPTVVTWA